MGDLVLANSDDAANSHKAVFHPDDEKQVKVHVVTAEDVDDGRFQITDVVMPLPGNRVVYPEDGTQEDLQKMLAADGLKEANFKHPIRDYTLSGAYRQMIMIPKDFSWYAYRM